MAGETKLYLYDADDPCMAGTATDFVVEDPKRHARAGVRSPGDIVKALGKYSNLKWVIVDSHGKSGELALPVPFTTSNAPLLAPCSASMAANARVLFVGCSIADGSTGRDFLVAAGSALLKGKGGVVGGSTVGTYMACIEILSFFTDAYLPKWGQLRVISFDTGGSVVKEVFVG